MGVETILRASRLTATPAMTDDNQLSFNLPSVSRKKVTAAFDGVLSSETKCNTPADLIIGTADQDLRECCHAMLFAFVG